MSPEERGPDFAYWVFSGIASKVWENMTVISPGTYGQEFVKTFGHYHNQPYGRNLPYGWWKRYAPDAEEAF